MTRRGRSPGKVEREKETKEAETVIVEKGGRSVEDGGRVVEWRDY